MRRILSERNLVVVLFVSAFVIFAFAQEDAKKVEKIYMYPAVVTLPPPPAQSASTEIKVLLQVPAGSQQ